MFLNVTMLAGISGAVLPLALHLLSRARCRSVGWGAMMFLGFDDAGRHHRMHLKELALLLLRMAIVAVLAMALARPVLGSRGAAMDEVEPSSTVILFDRSASMGLEENGRTRLETARRAVLGAMSSLRRGDQAAMILMPEPMPRQTPQLSGDLQALAARVSEVRVSANRADIADGLAEAARALENSRNSVRQILLVTDRQAESWRDVSGNFAMNWRQGANWAGSSPPRLYVISVGGDDAGNVAVESLRVLNPPVIKDTPAEIEVRVKNYDTVPRSELPLSLSVGGREVHRADLSFEAGASTVIRRTVNFSVVGSQVLTARIGDAGLPGDDVMECAIEVTGPIGVLVLSGDRTEGAARFRGAADYIRVALAPFRAAGRTGPDPADVQVVAAKPWPKLDRTRYRVLVLADVARLSAEQAREIEQFVYDGGGLLVAPGSRCDVSNYNGQLWRDGAGVLPAELEAPVGAEGSPSTSLLGLELAHPIFRFLQGRDDPVPALTIGRYFPARGAEPRAHILGRYASGKPFLLEGTYGRGLVMLVTTSLDADWSTLPLSSFYLPMLQSTVRYLASEALLDRNLSPGEPIVAVVDDAAEPHATIEAPGAGPATIDLVPVGSGHEARFTNTSRPGRYTLRFKTNRGPAQIHFIVRPNREESDLTVLGAGQWTSLQRSLSFERIEAEPQAIASVLGESRRRQELGPLLLAGVMALAIAEMALARAWTRGGARP